jgi:hypothetical protein
VETKGPTLTRCRMMKTKSLIKVFYWNLW